MKKNVLIMMGAVAAAGIYSAVKGKGPFNKIRFKELHEKISNYVETHYPYSWYSPISATEKGWVTVITNRTGDRVLLYVSCDENGNYIYNENKI